MATLSLFFKHLLLYGACSFPLSLWWCKTRKTKNVAHHSVLQGLNHQPLQFLINRAPERNLEWKTGLGTPCFGQAGPLDKMYISGRILMNPDTSISPEKCTKMINLSYFFFVNSSSLLPRCMLDCMSSLAKSHVQTGLSLNFLEHIPQSYWEALSWAISSVAQPCPQQSLNKTLTPSSYVMCFSFSWQY